MTKEQFQDIEARLQKWREARGLSVEDQKKNFKVNYAKELIEYFEAERDGDEYGMIDALCDMCIVAINAGYGILEPTKLSKYNSDSDLVCVFAPGMYGDIDFLLANLYNRGYDPYKCLLETIKELESRSGAWNEKEGKWCKDIGAYTLNELNRDLVDNIYGEDHEYWYFTPRLGKELGREVGKVKKWYKADYSKCKLKA